MSAAECEVWDHVTLEERIYDQALWCQCGITSFIQLGQSCTQRGGRPIQWPQPAVPEGGRTERAFRGKVISLADDHVYTVTTEEFDQYQDYLMGQYYLGPRNGKPVTVSQNPAW